MSPNTSSASRGTGTAGVAGATGTEIPRLAELLSAAFDHNTVSDWIFDGEQRHYNPAFFTPFLQCALDAGQIDQTVDGSAVAVWLNMTNAVYREWFEILHDDVNKAVGPHLRTWQSFEAAADAVHPEGPHWYLAFLGTAPTNQRRGQAGRLLRHAASWLGDEAAYLEATSRWLVRYYGKHGWEEAATIVVPSGPRLYGMRYPAPGTVAPTTAVATDASVGESFTAAVRSRLSVASTAE